MSTAHAEHIQRVPVAEAAAPGTPHPDPVLAAKGWRANHLGIWARKSPEPEADREAGQ